MGSPGTLIDQGTPFSSGNTGGAGAGDSSILCRAKELTSDLRRLQQHVESLDALLLQDNVLKVRDHSSGQHGSDLLSHMCMEVTWPIHVFLPRVLGTRVT